MTTLLRLAAVLAALTISTMSAEARRHVVHQQAAEPTVLDGGSYMIEKNGTWIYVPPGASRAPRAWHHSRRTAHKSPRAHSRASGHAKKPPLAAIAAPEPQQAIPEPPQAVVAAIPETPIESAVLDANGTPAALTSCRDRLDCAYMRRARAGAIETLAGGLLEQTAWIDALNPDLGRPSLAEPMGRLGRRAEPDIITEPKLGHEIAATKNYFGGGKICSRKTHACTHVAAHNAFNFQNYMDDVEAWSPETKIYYLGGYRAGTCSLGSQHPCGDALDVCQDFYGHVSGLRDCHLPPPAVMAALARKNHIYEASVWCHSDYGHVQARYSGGGCKAKGWVGDGHRHYALVTMTGEYRVASLPPAKIPLPDTIEQTGNPSRLTDLALYAYNEYLPTKPAAIALATLKDVPVGNAKQEALRAADAFGHDHRFMLAVAMVESDFNCGNTTGQYKGTFQLSKHEFDANLGGDGIKDCRRNAFAAAGKFVTERILFEHAMNREATFEDMYLVHQQGIGGAVEHLTHPDRVAWKSMCATEEGQEKGAAWCKKAVWGNTMPALKARVGSVEMLTSGAFVEHWNKRVAGLVGSKSPETQTISASAERPKRAERHTHRRHQRTRVAYYQASETYDAYANVAH